MRLINYGTGEILDRLSILALKILHGRRASKDVTHFERERTALVAQLTSRTGGLNQGAYFGGFDLAALNGTIWHEEDNLREMRRLGKPASDYGDWGPIVDCAFALQALNDLRALAVEAINTATGENYGRDKLFLAGSTSAEAPAIPPADGDSASSCSGSLSESRVGHHPRREGDGSAGS